MRRLYLIIAATLLTVGSIAVAVAPAQADPPDCAYSTGHTESAGEYIYAWAVLDCEIGEDVDKPVAIMRYQSPGVYQTVASGTGTVTYYCTGTLYNVYKTTGRSDFAILCS